MTNAAQSGTSEQVKQVKGAVRRGAALLDEKEPGWRDRISPADLDLEICEQCVLGQVLGDYEPQRLGLLEFEEECDNGFEVADSWSYKPLTDAWIGYIKGEWS